MGFTKVFAELTSSSVWNLPYPHRIVWTALMSNCQMDGIVRVSWDSVWRLANVTPEEAEDALRAFLEPDEMSRSPEHDGRRIQRVDGGIMLLNYMKYRERLSPESRRQYMRDYMRRKRAENRGEKTCKLSLTPVNRRREKLTEVSWRDSYRLEAEAACATVAPVDLPEEIRAACAQFSEFRFELATAGKTKADCRRWSPQQAQSFHQQIRLALKGGMPPQEVSERILRAASGGYKNVPLSNLFRA